MEKEQLRQRKIYLGNGRNATISLARSSRYNFDRYTILRFADFEIFTLYEDPKTGDTDFHAMNAKEALSCIDTALANESSLRYFKGSVGATMLLPLN